MGALLFDVPIISPIGPPMPHFAIAPPNMPHPPQPQPTEATLANALTGKLPAGFKNPGINGALGNLAGMGVLPSILLPSMGMAGGGPMLFAAAVIAPKVEELIESVFVNAMCITASSGDFACNS